MPFNNSGTFQREHRWVDDKAAHRQVDAVRMDREDDGIATGLSNAICKDGQTTTIAPIPFAQGIKVSDGTVGAPPLSFIDETDTGLYRVGANTVGIAVDGTKIIDIATATVSVNAAVALTVPLGVASGGTGASTANTARVYSATASQGVISTSTETVIYFEQTTHDPNNMHDDAGDATAKSKITVATDGVYLIVGHWDAQDAAHSVFGSVNVSIKKNGTDFLARHSYYWDNTLDENDFKTTVSTIAQLTAGDYIQLTVQQQTGTTLRTQFTSGVSPVLSLARMVG